MGLEEFIMDKGLALVRRSIKKAIMLTLATNFSLAIHSLANASTLTVNGGGFVKVNGHATLNGNVQTNSSGELFPDENLGCLSLNNLSFESGAILHHNLAEKYYTRDTACEHYNQLIVSGEVNLSNASLSINLLADASTYSNTNSMTYGTTLISNTGANRVNGYFNGIREGGVIRVENDYYMHVTYLGGDGNDVYIWRWDDDNDGIGNRADHFSDDATEWLDSDGDGIGDNADAMPNNAAESVDSDGDGIGDNADAFPNNPLESVDSDGDGIGDNRDAFPNDPSEDTDSDGDGIGDNAETDKDNDGLDDDVDSCPLNANADQLDSDGDSVGDACDIDNDGDGLIDISSLSQLYNIRFNLTGVAYNDGYFESSASCGNGVAVTTCNGYELLNDVDFDENGDGELNDTYNQEQGWLPIGDSANRFDSIFEGNGFQIKNMVINNSNRGHYIGFFGYIEYSKIQNLHFSGSLTSITSEASYVGGIVGRAGVVVDVENLSFEGAIHASENQKYIGGLFGHAGQADIYDSHSIVTINGGAEYIGGLAGVSSVARVERNYANVNITTTGNKVGGLIGYRSGNTIANNYTVGTINSTGSDIGGLVGHLASGVYDSFSHVNVTGDYAVGGLVGYSESSIARNYAKGAINGNLYAGGLVGQYEGSSDNDNLWDIETTNQATSESGSGYNSIDLQMPITNSGFYENWSIAEWDFGAENQYPALILNGIVHRDTDLDGSFDHEDIDDDNDGVEDNLDAFPTDSSEWDDTDNDGMGNNADTDDDNDGVLDQYDDFPLDSSEQYDADNDGIGNNADTDDDDDGLLDGADNCSAVSNIDQLDSDNDGYGNACDIDNDADGLIEISTLVQLNNIRNNLTGTGYHDGNINNSAGCGDGVIVTVCSGYELSNSLDFDENGDGIANDSFNQGEGWQPIGTFKATFDGNNYQILNLVINNTSTESRVGFFSQANSSSIRNIHFTGQVLAQASHVGGVLGSVTLSSEFHNVSFVGDVSTSVDKDYLGGLIGYASQGDVTASRFIGNVTGGNNHVAGLVGFKAWGSVNRNYTEGTVTANGDRVGGLVGSSWNGRTDYNYSTSNVTGVDYVGGLVGYFSGSSIKLNYSIGEISGNNYVGNVVGFDSLSTTSDSYWNTDLSSQPDNGVGTGYTTAEIQAPTDNSGIYSNWGTTYWDYGTDSQYPALIIEGVVHRDSDNDNVFDQLDDFPNDTEEWLDTDDDGTGNNADLDDDNDGLSDTEEANLGTDPLDKDTDNDGIEDGLDDLPLDTSDSIDTDFDGIGNNTDTDDDNDGVADSVDAFPLDVSESVDTDLDGIGNNADSDDDNDGVEDSADAFPLDASESVDSDLDGVGNNADSDDDNDGVVDSADAFPLDATESVDTDLDGIGNNADTDDDNDGVVDSADAFPLDATESVDTDLDGIGNNADTDDDNDGVVDSADAFPLDASESVDTDLDGVGNNADKDDDNDGVVDSADAFPLDASESIDTDLDGIGNNADTDDDNDGVVDSADAFPLDATESVDTDLDGIGNNADTDDDNDGVEDSADAFPLDASESIDTDLDGIGNNADSDDDNDGVEDSADAFPLDATESVDTDLDGIGNNADTDDDNDGIPDDEDDAPLDRNNGDNQAPVIGELPPLTFEAEGITTTIDLPTPEVTDNNLNPPTVMSNLTSPLEIGEHAIIWTATDFFGNQSTKEQLVMIVDTTAPEFDANELITIEARGRLTDISNLVHLSAIDLVDGELNATIIGKSQYRSGSHLVEVEATDNSGNRAATTVDVHILPELNVKSFIFVMAGGDYSLPVMLSGQAPTYPVNIEYVVKLNDEQLINSSAVMDSGVTTNLNIQIPSDVNSDDILSVEIENVSNAFIDRDNVARLSVIERNLKPRLKITKQQNDQNVSIISSGSGRAYIEAVIKDVNIEDRHDVSWQVVNDEISDFETSDDGLKFEFEPRSLIPGRYFVDVLVAETNTLELYSISRRIQIIIEDSSALSNVNDSDNDGIVDSEEGTGDSDNDGISNYLDDDANTTRLPIEQGNEPMQVVSGYSLSVGTFVQSLNGTSSQFASMSIEDLANVILDTDQSVYMQHYQISGAVFDFAIDGLVQVGDSVAVIIPLADGNLLSDKAYYRKYAPTKGWYDFIVDDKNTISSALSDDEGQCPNIDSESYRIGLNEGDDCIQLLIEDGGPNDSDMLLNGSITDPGAIFYESVNQLPAIELPSRYIVDEESDVILDASGTRDAEGDELAYQWRQVSGIEVELIDANQSKLSFTSPSVMEEELLIFELSVDDSRDISQARTDVIVNHVNKAPAVTIGVQEISIVEGSSEVLVAVGVDPDNDTLTYQWRQISGPQVSFDDESNASTVITAPTVANEETVEIQVMVSDGELMAINSIYLQIKNVVEPSEIIPETKQSSGGAFVWLLFFLVARLAVIQMKRFPRYQI